MKNFITLILLFMCLISFGQKNEYKQALVLSNNKNHIESNVILVKLLNNEFGLIDNETCYFILYTIAENYHGLKDFQNMSDYYNLTIDFGKKNHMNEESLKDITRLSELNNIFLEFTKALNFLDNKNYYVSNMFFQKLLNNDFGVPENEDQCKFLVNIGINYEGLKNYKSSFEFYNKAIDFSKKNHVLEDLVSDISKKAEIVKINIIN